MSSVGGDDKQKLSIKKRHVTVTIIHGGINYVDSVHHGNNTQLSSPQTELSSPQINWNTDRHGIHWARGCDFPGNDFKSVGVVVEECGPLCKNTNGCTHFTYYRGICWLKNNNVAHRIIKFKDGTHCGFGP